MDATRIEEALPIIKYLHDNHAKIVIITLLLVDQRVNLILSYPFNQLRIDWEIY